MAEKRTRRRFTYAQAVRRLVEGGYGLPEVAAQPGLNTGQLNTSRTQLLAPGSVKARAQRKAEEAKCCD